MKNMQRLDISRRAVLALGAGAFMPLGHAAESEWSPTKPVRIVVPIVGSTNDVLARLVAGPLGKVLGQPVVVENKGGAGGTIGTVDVVRSAPDGHTLLVGYNGPLAINPTLQARIPYDVSKDLAPITLAVMSPQFLAVNPAVPVHNVAEFVALAKQKKLSYASVSPGSASHLTMEMLKSAAGIDITHIPYKGGGPAVTDLVGGQVDAAFLVPGNIIQFAREGKARLIACTGKQRFRTMPDVPTMIEQGFPGFEAVSWIGFLAPGGTPKPIIDRYNKEIVKILHSPEVAQQLERIDFDVVAGTPEQFSSWIQSETQRWGEVIKSTHLKIE